MADLIKTFYAYGKYFEDDLLESFNQLSSKKIDKILHIELSDYSFALRDPSTIKDRLILYITSSAGGNLFPFIFLSEKLFDIEAKGKVKKGAIKKSFDNMKKYLTKEELQELESIYSNIDFKRLKELVEDEVKNKSNLKENWYIALSYDGEFFNEKFPDVFKKMIETKGSDVLLNGHCFIDESASKIGFDVGLNFCSTNELSKGMAREIKPRLLPISNEVGRFVKLGFEKIFNDFVFKLFGLNYILLPTVFDSSLQDEVFKTVNDVKKIDYRDEALEQRVIFEEDLEEIVEEFDKKSLTKEILFTMLFYEKNNKEIVVSHTIEDILPSRIATAKSMMKKYNIDASKLSKYEKKTLKTKYPELIYIRDYINDRLFLAKLLFGKEQIDKEMLYRAIYKKIIFGNGVEHKKRNLTDILSQKSFFDKNSEVTYDRDDTDFKKHQRLLNFLSDKRLNMTSPIELGGEMEFKNLETLIEWKFENVEMLLDEKSMMREFYILGLLASLIVKAQKFQNRDNEFRSSLENYLNSIGLVNSLNINQVFNEIDRAYKRYNETVNRYYFSDYEYLMKKWSEVRSLQKATRSSQEKANILFVMGFVDYRNLPKIKKGVTS